MEFLSAIPLKRDEFYIFLGGLFLSISWMTLDPSCPSKYADTSLYNILVFILLWLLCTAIIFFAGYTLSFIFPHLTNSYIAKKELDPYKLANVKDEENVYYNLNLYGELRIQLHICNICLSCSLLSYYPLLNLVSKYLVCSSLFHLIFIPIILLIIYSSFKAWLLNSALFDISAKKGGLRFYDIKKYSELTAEVMVNELNMENK